MELLHNDNIALRKSATLVPSRGGGAALRGTGMANAALLGDGL